MNNYDTSSTGVNIEVSAFHDCHLSQAYFDESFHVLRHSGYRENALFIYTEGDDGVPTDLEELYSHYGHNHKDLFKSIIERDLPCEREALGLYRHYMGKSLRNSTAQDVREFANNFYIAEDYETWRNENLTPLFTIITTRGYSQGDYAEVIVPDCLGIKDIDALRTSIHHLVWDAPIHCRVVIDGEEYHLEEALDGYNWDADLVVEYLNGHLEHERKEAVLTWLSENLPAHLDYLH